MSIFLDSRMVIFSDKSIQNNFQGNGYLNYIIQHGALHQECVVASLDPGDAALVAGDEDRGVVALHELPHLKRRRTKPQ